MSRLGGLFAGAGVVGQGMREEAEAQRVAELNQMRLEEARRMQQARVNALREASQTASAQNPQWAAPRAPMDTIQASPPPAPQARRQQTAGLSTPQAQPQTGAAPQADPRPAVERATNPPTSQRAADAAAGEPGTPQVMPSAEEVGMELGVPPGTNIPPRAMEALRLIADRRGIPMQEIPLDAGFETAYNYVVERSGGRVSDLWDIGISAVGLARPPDPQGGRPDGMPSAEDQAITPVSPESYVLGGVGAVRGSQFARRGYDAIRNNRAQLEALRAAQARAAQAAGRGSPEARRQVLDRTAQRTVAPTPSPDVPIRRLAQAGITNTTEGGMPEGGPQAAQPITDQDVQAAEQAVEQGSEPSDAPVARSQAGLQQQQQRVFGNEDFYLANPEAVTQEMQQALQQRQNLVRMARIYGNAGMGFKAMEVANQINQLDNSMLYLQGMQGIHELSYFRDPRRVAGALSSYLGQQIDFQPRSDGTYNIITFDADGNPQLVNEGVTSERIAEYAMMRLSPEARQRAAELEQERQTRMIEMQANVAESTAEHLNAIQLAMLEGNYSLAEARARSAGIKLEDTQEGIMAVGLDEQGNQFVRMLEPGQEASSSWFGLSRQDEVPPSFREVQMPSGNTQMLPQSYLRQISEGW